MAIVHPFRALRPLPEPARDIAAVPYDVVTSAEARALAKQALHEGPDVEANLGPKRLVVGFKDDPFQRPVEALFDI